MEHVALTKCFYCGKDNEILLATKYRRDKNGEIQPLKDMAQFNGTADPRRPCNECIENMKKAVMVCEVRDGEHGDNPYRTGKQWGLRQEACERIFPGVDFNKYRFIYIEESNAIKLGLHEAKV